MTLDRRKFLQVALAGSALLVGAVVTSGSIPKAIDKLTATQSNMLAPKSEGEYGDFKYEGDYYEPTEHLEYTTTNMITNQGRDFIKCVDASFSEYTLEHGQSMTVTWTIER